VPRRWQRGAGPGAVAAGRWAGGGGGGARGQGARLDLLRA
jgi:hypothetical protein